MTKPERPFRLSLEPGDGVHLILALIEYRIVCRQRGRPYPATLDRVLPQVSARVMRGQPGSSFDLGLVAPHAEVVDQKLVPYASAGSDAVLVFVDPEATHSRWRPDACPGRGDGTDPSHGHRGTHRIWRRELMLSSEEVLDLAFATGSGARAARRRPSAKRGASSTVPSTPRPSR